MREQSVKRVWHSERKSRCHLIVKSACLHSHTVPELKPSPLYGWLDKRGSKSKVGFGPRKKDWFEFYFKELYWIIPPNILMTSIIVFWVMIFFYTKYIICWRIYRSPLFEPVFTVIEVVRMVQERKKLELWNLSNSHCSCSRETEMKEAKKIYK